MNEKKTNTRVINETTFRIFCSKTANTEPVTQDLSSPTTSTTAPFKSIIPERAIEEKETTNTQSFFFVG